MPRSTSTAFFATALPALTTLALTTGISSLIRCPNSTAPFSRDFSILSSLDFRSGLFAGAGFLALTVALLDAVLALAADLLVVSLLRVMVTSL